MDMEPHFYGSVKVPIGLPVFESAPLACVLSSTDKENSCDCCFASTIDLIQCPKCKSQWYCSEKCRVQDLPFHEPECLADLHSKILNNFNDDAIKDKVPEIFFSNDEIIDYSRLFFRVIKSTKSVKEVVDDESVTDNSYMSPSEPVSIGNQKQIVSWDDINCPLELSEKLVEMEHTALINHYLNEYDDLTEDERKEFDEQLGLDIPDDEHFKEMVLENDVRSVINSTVNEVVNLLSQSSSSFDSYNASNGNFAFIDDPSSFKSSQEKSDVENTSTNPASTGTSERFFDYFFSQLKQNNILEKIISLPKDNRVQFLSNCFENFKVDSDRTQNFCESAPATSTEAETDLLEEIDTQLESFKFCYRIFRIDTLYGEKMQLECKPLDGMFCFWVIQLREILESDGVKEHYGHYTWEEIVKAFFVTLRYSIAISDFICRSSIARGVYLPMTLIGHSCIPSTAAVFDGPNLKLFYLPTDEIKVKSSHGFKMKVTYDSDSETILDSRLADSETPASLLPYMPLNKPMVLNSLTFDYQHDLFFRIDFSILFVNEKLRMIDCFCQLCSNYNDDGQSKSDEDDEINLDAMDDDFGVFPKKEQQNPSQQNNSKSMTKENHYARCKEIVEQLTAQYGNLQEEVYAMKVQTPLEELILHYRQVLGHYHPKISVFLLFLTYSHLVLIRWQRRKASGGQQSLDYVIFYQYKQMHSCLIEAISAFAITHGFEGKVVRTLKTIHEVVHEKLGQLYATCKEIIAKVERSTENWSEEIFGKSSKCNQIMSLKSVVRSIDKDKLIDALGKVVLIDEEEDDGFAYLNTNDLAAPMDCDDDDDGYGFNPFIKRPRYSTDEYDSCDDPDPFANDEESEAQKKSAKEKRAKRKEFDGKATEEEDDILKLFASICEFEEFRKL